MARRHHLSAFAAWAASYGHIKLAKELKMTRQGVTLWLRGDCVPKPPMAAKIIKLADGQVSWADIYNTLLEK